MATRAIITDHGRSQIAAALAGDYKIVIQSIVIGSGRYTDDNPIKPSQTSLLNPIGELTEIGKEVTGSWTYYTGKIPYSLTDVTVREIGVLDTNNELIVIASIPDIELIESKGGVFRDIPIRLGVTTAIGDVLIVEAPSSLPVFTNDSLGIIQGKKEDGYVYRLDPIDIDEEDDPGFGKVYGWENTFKKVSEDEQEVSATTVYLEDTYAYYRIFNPEQGIDKTRLFWHLVNDTIKIGDTDAHLHFNTNIPDNAEYGDHITATTPEGNKAVAWLDDLGNGITHYAFNSGSVQPSNGDPDYAYLSGSKFGIKAGTVYTDGMTTHTLAEDIFLTFPQSDENDYNVYIEYNKGTKDYTLSYKDNSEFRQRQRPTVANDGDYWLRTLEPLEAYWVHKDVETNTYTFEPTEAVYCFRLTHTTVGTRYLEYHGTVTVDPENQTLDVTDYSVITPENFHWDETATGIMEDPELQKYKISTKSSGLAAVMPDYAWNGYNVNTRTLSEFQSRTLPDITGHVGQILMTDGLRAYWTTINALIENSLANTFYHTDEPPPVPVLIDWTQPTLTSNESTSFSVSIESDATTISNTQNLYKIFIPNNGNFSIYTADTVATAEITMTSTDLLQPTQLEFEVLSGETNGTANNVVFYGSVDNGSSWVELATVATVETSTTAVMDLSTITSMYSIFKLKYETSGISGSEKCTIAGLKLSAKYYAIV